MAKPVLIGCKLPNGIILDVDGKTAELNGLNKSVIIGATYAITTIDADFWAAWKAQNATYPALSNGVIFEAESVSSAKDISKDTDKSGFEPMPQIAELKAA